MTEETKGKGLKLELIVEGNRTRVNFEKMGRICSKIGLNTHEIETIIRFNRGDKRLVEIDTPDNTFAKKCFDRGWNIVKVLNGGPWVRFEPLPYGKLSIRSKNEPEEPEPDDFDADL